MWKRTLWIAALLASTACGGRGGAASDTGSTGSGEAGSGEAGGPDMAETGEPACDTPGPDGSCSIWCQDCSTGQKCVPILEGVDAFTKTACVPIVDGAHAMGDECEADYEVYNDGIDDCGPGLFCWNLNVDTGKGVCMPFCDGTPEAPECSGSSSCMRRPSLGEVAVCEEMCDPIDGSGDPYLSCVPSDPTCLPPECFPLGASAGFWPLSVPLGLPGLGETCGLAGCGAGAICVDRDATAGCQDGQSGCCVAYCDLASPNCDGGEVCKSVFEDGAAPPGLAHVGACLAG